MTNLKRQEQNRNQLKDKVQLVSSVLSMFIAIYCIKLQLCVYYRVKFCVQLFISEYGMFLAISCG